MTEEPRDKPAVTAVVNTIEGTAASDDGQSVKVGITSSGGVRADLILPVDRATDLMALLSAALGQAARNRSGDPSQIHGLPATRWQVYETPEPQMPLLAFQLAGGAELFFRIEAQSPHRSKNGQLAERTVNMLQNSVATAFPRATA